MMTGFKLKFFIALMMMSQTVFGAVYNLPSHLINIPVANSINFGDVEYGMSMGFYNSEVYEFDSKLNFGVTNRSIVGLNWVNEDNWVVHYHYNFYGNETTPFAVSGGVLNISKNKYISSWNDYSVTQENNISPYLVLSRHMSIMNIHFGYGEGRFKYGDTSTVLIENVDGLIMGLEVPIYRSMLGFEFDGKDFNFGLRMPLTQRSTLYVALTELGNTGTTNPQYNNSPVRAFSFGVVHRYNLFKVNNPKKETFDRVVLEADQTNQVLSQLKLDYESEIDALRQQRDLLSEEIARLRSAVRADLKYIDQQDGAGKDEFRAMYLGINQDVSEQVLSYYYSSFEYYSQKNYHKAIDVLQRAVTLNPYLPQLYTRLGSIYYELDLKDMAKVQWEKAIELDPDNPEVKRFLKTLDT